MLTKEFKKEMKKDLRERILKDIEREDVAFLYASDKLNLILLDEVSELLTFISESIYKLSKVKNMKIDDILTILKAGLEEYEK